MKRITGLLALLALGACSIAPETGRRQLKLFPAEYMNTMGVSAYADATSGFPELTSGAEYDMVQRIGARIAAASNVDYEWEFKLLDEPNTINAFALPGGKVAVYTGLLRVTQNEDALAAVMGHEVAHAVLGHGNERMTQNALATGASTILDLALAGWTDLGDAERAGWMQAFALGADVAALKPFSRQHESEADKVGLRYLIRAGYDPSEAPKLWERMAALSPERGPAFMSTHPDPLERAKALQAWIPEEIETVRQERAKGASR